MKSRADLAKNQLDAVEWMLETPRAALWKDIGLGKTVTTLTVLDVLHKRFEIGNTLVVSSLRIARSVWPKEVRKWEHLQHLRVVPILGKGNHAIAQRARAMNTPADVHTINFENLVWLIDHFKAKGESHFKRAWPWDTVILDESSGFKNRDTNRWKAMRRIVRETSRLYELTGSPAPNGYIDVWAPMYLLDFGQRLGTTLTAYRNRWFDPPNQYDGTRKWTIKSHGEWSAEDVINERIEDIVQPMRAEDYLDLPEIMANVIPVELSDQDAQAYRHMEKELWLELQGEEITAVNRGVLYQKLLQLANGSIYTGDDGRWVWFHDAKLDVLEELVRESLGLGRPAMVIHAFRADQERIQGRMAKMGVSYRLLKSQQDEDDWNAGKLDVLGMHPKSGGHGLNLQDGGETVIWFGLNPSWELYNQANGRLAGGRRRMGKNIRIHHLVTEGTLDGDVMALLEDKETTEDRLWAGVARRQKEKR